MNPLIIILGLAGLVFWIVELISMLKSRIPKKDKGLWFIAFMVASLLTAIVWLIVRRKK